MPCLKIGNRIITYLKKDKTKAKQIGDVYIWPADANIHKKNYRDIF